MLAVFSLLTLTAAAEDYLAPEVAFKFSARMANPKTVEVSYAIADGYYMYRERFAFKAEGATLGTPSLPPGKIKFDATFQKDVESYRNALTIRLPVEAQGPFSLTITSQGCADAGLCYSPMESKIRLSPDGRGGLLAAIAAVRGENQIDTPQGRQSVLQNQSVPPVAAGVAVTGTSDSEMGRIEAALQSRKLLVILPLFLLLGIGLAFTPCVLPMMPILSSIIVGEGERVSRSRGLLLAASYSLGMALVYTLLGVIAGLLGEGLSAPLQSPWVLSAFALIMSLLALSMFGVYQLQMPAAVRDRLQDWSQRQSGGKLAGVFMMGALSALIVSPCVAAPLAGVLVYLSQTRDVVIGGSALFAIAAGMSVPLLLIGASAGALLPRSGPWMEQVKRFFGVLMLGVAWWMLAPILAGWLQMLGWALLGVGYGAYLLFSRGSGWLPKAAGILFAVLGLIQFSGVATGGRDPLSPLSHFTGAPHTTKFLRVKSVAELDATLTQVKGKTVMLDFYADWCVSCKEMEKLTFADKRVQAKFADMVLLQADVTANNAEDKALLKRFNLFGPPGIIFFDKQGREIPGGRVIGYQNTDRFLQSLALAAQF